MSGAVKFGLLFRCTAVSLGLALSACASITHGDKQRLHVEAACGPRMVPALCTVSNGKGSWQLQAPGSVVMVRDSSTASISCTSPFIGAVTVPLHPGPSMAMAGNVLLGGLVGAGVDVVTGAGLSYPARVKVMYPGC